MSPAAVTRWPALVLALIAVAVLGRADPPSDESGNAGSRTGEPSDAWVPEIPKTWDDEAVETLELPLFGTPEVEHVDEDYYYRIPERKIYKSYPVYHPDREPPGYMEELAKKEPELAIDFSKLKTKDDWIAAGKLVFEAPIIYNGLNQVDKLRDPEWYEKTGVPVTSDGIMPFNRYAIREKGKVDVAEFSCATCHTRVMPDGSAIQGAQGNYPLAWLDTLDKRESIANAKDRETLLKKTRNNMRIHYGAPWLEKDPQKRHEQMSLEELEAAQGAIPAGVMHRVGASYFDPVQVPDLIGVKDRRYLDRTGLVRHRGIGDFMRYAALNQDLIYMIRYNDFFPAGKRFEPELMVRYSDEALYALALYVYSLTPPENPNKFDALAERGQEVFKREECWRCHEPPLYTNNRLTPVDGFDPPEDHPARRDIIPFSVGTDPGLAVATRRGTGFYKVPSLKGVWYRGPFQHSGAVATLEDWLDRGRLEEDYRPTGFRGVAEKRAVKGHKFGLDLSREDRKALIAFLKTL